MRTVPLTILVQSLSIGMCLGNRANISDEPALMVAPQSMGASAIVPPSRPTDGGEVLCGDFDYDGNGALAAQRRDSDGLESWTMARCDLEEPIEIQGFNWLAAEFSDEFWSGFADFAIWDADTVEQGCADDSNTIAAARDLANTRELVLDDFNFDIWKYHLSLIDPPVLEPGAYYFGVRNVVSQGQSFIMTVPCNGRPPIYFQSEFFGYPCAVPSGEVFGVDYCVAIEVLGEPFCADDGCGKFRKLVCKGEPKFKVVARGKGVPGGALTLNLDGEDTCVAVDARGKWKFIKKNAPGSHTATACGSVRSCSH